MAAPKLRFKEFDKAFSRNTIKELAKIYVGRDLVEDAYSPIKTETHIYPIYSNSVDNEGLYGYYNFEEFNFDDDALTVVGRGAGLGKAFYRQGGFGTIGRLLSLTPKDKSFHPKYLSDYINDKLIIHNESGGIPQLPRSSLENYEVVLPSYEEQTKIASFLSNVDEKISQLTQKHELLSQYKQGMMQKLFSQQIRFKADDGSEFGEWEERKLSEISQKAMYGMNAAATEYDGINKYLRITDICEFSNSFKKDNLTSPNAELFDRYKLQLGDLLFARTGASVGKSYLYREDDGITYFAGFLIKFSLNTNLVIPYFIFLQTLTKEFCQWVVTNSMRSGQPGINAEEYSSYIFKVPCLEEQTKIANFLSSIDQKIEVVAQQIEQAKTWKKGLLQQMFV